jgi:hypothetical protein
MSRLVRISFSFGRPSRLKKRKEIHALPVFLGSAGGDHHHRISHAHHGSAVRLLGELAHLYGQGGCTDGHLFLVNHLLLLKTLCKTGGALGVRSRSEGALSGEVSSLSALPPHAQRFSLRDSLRERCARAEGSLRRVEAEDRAPLDGMEPDG